MNKLYSIIYKGFEVKINERQTMKTASIIFNQTNSTCVFKDLKDLHSKLDKKIESNKNFKRIDLTGRLNKLENITINKFQTR